MAIKSVHRPQGEDPFGLGAGGLSFGPTPLASYGGLQDKSRSFLEPGREAQLSALAQMREAAEGRGGPSVAQTMLQQGGDRAALAAVNQSAMTRGGNLAGANQMAMGTAAGLGAQTAQQAATLRAQEQAAAQQQYAAMATQLAQQGMGYDELAQNTLLQGTGLEQDWRLGNRGMDIQEDQYNRNRWLEFAKMGMQGLGSALGALSDERAKLGVESAPLTASQVVGSIPEASSVWEYKSDYGPPGTRIGPMAQAVEEVYPAGVIDTPRGKALDIGSVASLTLAATSDLKHEVDELKSALAGMTGDRATVLSDERAKTAADDMGSRRMEDAGSALSTIGRSMSAAGGAQPGPDGMGTILDKLAERRRERLSGGGLAMMSDARSKRAVGY